MLSDQQRHALNELERQLERDDPAWARQFLTFAPHQPDETSTTVNISIVIAVMLMLLGLVLGNPQIFVTFCGTALVLTFIRLRL
jgi:hypothetical protein